MNSGSTAVKWSTDKLVALQYIAVALPLATVLLVQAGVDTRRANALERSMPLRILANQARNDFQIFTNGAADAVDTGTLRKVSIEALQTGALRLGELAGRSGEPDVLEAARRVRELGTAIGPGATLNTLLPLTPRIAAADALTKSIDAEFERRNARVVGDAIESAVEQRRAMIAALLITAVVTIVFVLQARRNLAARIEADIMVERRRRAELEAISIRFGLATRAARAGVYEIRGGGADVWWSDTMREIYGETSAQFRPTSAAWLEKIHPDDREGVQAAVRSAMLERHSMHADFRIIRPDGSICHLTSLAAVSENPADGSTCLVGIDLDVTGRVNAEQRERQLQQQLRDASRRAGMAEIATNVLHNVGNVLNSVNVSVNVLVDAVKHSRAAGLERAVGLLREHAADLPAFISQHERGRHFPAYLAVLSEQLTVEKSAMGRELDELRANIDHIKQIVGMQQTFARRCGVAELTSMAELVEDALRMNSGSFQRHRVSLDRDFEAVPDITVDKHRVIQILVNLLHNAIHACSTVPEGGRRVIVRLARLESGVRITVTDNGTGIDPEHLPQIFRHGFTTKADGHGFGLHGGAIAAREMGGALSVHSDGRNQGATFTLDLPIDMPAAAGDTPAVAHG